MSLLERFEREVGGVIESHSERVVDGRCEDYQQYARATGIIYGMKHSLEIFKEIIKSGEGTEE